MTEAQMAGLMFAYYDQTLPIKVRIKSARDREADMRQGASISRSPTMRDGYIEMAEEWKRRAEALEEEQL